MTTFVLDDLQDGYVQLIRDVVKSGNEVSPRGMRTREVIGATVILKNPARSVPVGVGRKLNLKIGAAESAQLIAGFSDAPLMTRISKNFASFVEYDRFFGGYGPRIYQQMPMIIRTLTQDPSSRQAGAVIWRPDDIALGTKDVPCTIELHFMIRDEKLHMVTTMRSNDCVWGVTYDFWQFTALQHAVAWALGVPVGEYIHHAASLHVYIDRDTALIDDLHDYDGADHPPMPAPAMEYQLRNTAIALKRWVHLRNTMEAAAGARDWVASHDSCAQDHGRWYRDALQEVWGEEQLCPSCRFSLPRKHFFGRSVNAARCMWCERDARYSLPIGTVARMMLSQGGICPIGGEDLQRGFVLDHDHRTGVARGLLCPNHNFALGHFSDDVEAMAKAIKYLDTADEANEWTTDFNFLYRARPRDGMK